jgi:hypothetical protein
MDFMQSSQSFIRVMKAPSDPPGLGHPMKIEIAMQAWSNKAFYVPNKGEVIAEWILAKLLKEKAGELCVETVHSLSWH